MKKAINNKQKSFQIINLIVMRICHVHRLKREDLKQTIKISRNLKKVLKTHNNTMSFADRTRQQKENGAFFDSRKYERKGIWSKAYIKGHALNINQNYLVKEEDTKRVLSLFVNPKKAKKNFIFFLVTSKVINECFFFTIK